MIGGMMLGIISPANAQNELNCGTDHIRAKLIQEHPEILSAEQALDKRTEDFVNSPNRSGQVYIIPIVFHIIHQYGPENISDAQIYDAVSILNRDYRKLNADTSLIVPSFDTLDADASIEFRLATIDPNGNCTNGIDRIASVETYIGDDESKLNVWNPQRYLNVWVVNQMENGVAGYAYYPSSVAGAGLLQFRDGVIILQNYIGSIGTSNASRSRALTHEIGHYLNLQHPWGNNNDPGQFCGDDLVADTPETKGWTTCNLNGSVCNPPIIENVQNYMDYSYCSVMFTYGQVNRMHAALNDNTASRNNLWSASNLAATGTDGVTNMLCAPTADFYPENYMACLNQPVTFYDNSTRGAATNWQWSFQDGNLATSTNASPSVSFNAPGWKTVTLTVSNAQGQDSKTITKSIYINDNTAQFTYPYSESFETAANYDNYYISRNLENNTTAFSRLTTLGYTGNSCVYLNGYPSFSNPLSDGAGDIDELVTPSFDLSGLSNGGLNFKYAYATLAGTSADITESLKIYSSVDCGETWIQRKVITGIPLCSAGMAGGSFFPNSNSLWSYGSVIIAPSMAVSNVRFKFVYTSSVYSNNLFIDDINIGVATNVSENDPQTGFSIFPNPGDGLITAQFNLDENSKGNITVIDLSGKIVRQISAQEFNQGMNTVQLDLSGLTHGVYFIQLKTDKQFSTIRYCKM